MADANSIYKCEICGNVVSVIEAHNGELVCCGQPMKKFEAKTEDEGKEKHVPVLTTEGNNVTVKVGEVEHPMEDKHFIELIQILKDDEVIAEKHLKPNTKPESTFCLKSTENLKARALCNVHGLWTN